MYSQLINYYLTNGHSNGWLDVMLRGIKVYPRFNNKIYEKKGYLINNGNGYQTLNSGYIPSIDETNQYDTDTNNLRELLLNVALGLDSNFTSKGTGEQPYFTDVIRLLDTPGKLGKLLVDRFRFQDKIKINKVARIDKERAYIIDSINQGHPVLIFMAGINIKAEDVGHYVLIDGYRVLSDNTFEVLINWGWGNADQTNDNYYSTNGQIIIPGHSRWKNFWIFKETRPLN
jgi:hypothetical protein